MKPPAAAPTPPASATVDSTSASERLLSKQPPSAPQERKRVSKATKRAGALVAPRLPSTALPGAQ
jgi:hypothetical protein